MRALPVEIFKSSFGDCSNGGISSRYNKIMLVCDDGFIEIDENNPPENLCVYVKRTLFGEEHDYIRPYVEADGVGWMSGGCICWSCDSRFPSNHPLQLHDRTESQKMYDELSR